MALPARVDGQPQRAPRPGVSSSLLAVAPTIDDPELRWLDGITWEPEGCTVADSAVVECLGNTSQLTPDAAGDVEAANPIYLWASDTCSALQYQSRDWIGRATRALDAAESFLLARELWTGTKVQAEGWDNQFLTSGDSTIYASGFPLAVDLAMSAMDGELTTCLRNRQGMIHVRPHMLPYLIAADLVWMSGTTWLSPNGHLIVADAGYTGSQPVGEDAPEVTDQWIYGTDMIYTRLGPVQTLPRAVTDENLVEVMDRDTNDITVWAGRFATWQWDHCCHIAVQVTLAPPA